MSAKGGCSVRLALIVPFLPELNVPDALTGPATAVLLLALGLPPPLLTHTYVAVPSALAVKLIFWLLPSPASLNETTRLAPLRLALVLMKCALSAKATDAPSTSASSAPSGAMPTRVHHLKRPIAYLLLLLGWA